MPMRGESRELQRGNACRAQNRGQGCWAAVGTGPGCGAGDTFTSYVVLNYIFPGDTMVKKKIHLPMQDMGIPSLGWGRFPGGGNGNPLQYSYLKNSMDRGAWRATVHGVLKSQTQLSHGACMCGLYFCMKLLTCGSVGLNSGQFRCPKGQWAKSGDLRKEAVLDGLWQVIARGATGEHPAFHSVAPTTGNELV